MELFVVYVVSHIDNVLSFEQICNFCVAKSAISIFNLPINYNAYITRGCKRSIIALIINGGLCNYIIVSDYYH